MKNVNKEKLIKKINKIQQLEKKLEDAKYNLHNMYNEIDRESQRLEDNRTKYNELINTSIEKVKDYSQSQLDEMIEVLKFSPKKIVKLKNKISKGYRQYQAIENKLYKLYNVR
ncbi:hypothetical protein HDR60_02805 [bacterium]|nr:hypothetical protein [bacterium]